MPVDLVCADILDWAKTYDGEPGHAILCDPPYNLASITERFGRPGSAPAQGDVFARQSRGFMNTTWDSQIAFRPETWAAIAQHLHPGAFLMAFGGSRTFHRMMVAMEDAGLIIVNTIAWFYGSGFPHATRIKTDTDHDETWAGHRYGAGLLKPAFEPIVVAQKPYGGTALTQIVATGAGAINIDAARIAGDAWSRKGNGIPTPAHAGYERVGSSMYTHKPLEAEMNPDGRWPANLTLSHAPGCNGHCVDGCPIKLLEEQSGERPAGSSVSGHEPSHTGVAVYGRYDRMSFEGHDDTGTAARFFHQSDWAHEVEERLASSDPFYYCPKASTAEREAGLDDFPAVKVNDGRQSPIDNAFQRGETERRNIHPTVKPIELTRYLATLLAPPAAYAPRRLIIPFAGVGSECVGAMLSGGWEHIIGIEQSADYVKIGQARLDYWQSRRHSQAKPKLRRKPANQLSLFGEDG